MPEQSRLTCENLNYWSKRSSGYSEVNKEELAGNSRFMWKEVIDQNISDHFPGRDPGTIHVLDVGTGPGFFAIILTELGYNVTAIDMTPEMLEEARSNAGDLACRINFRRMNAEALDFSDESFDVVISRNLTWNLPHPDIAYSEWHRVLRKGGLLLNFDSNWYNYLFNDDALEAYESDRANSKTLGLGDQNVGDNFDVMEDIARKMPLSCMTRPSWDIHVLSGFGFDVSVNERVWEKVWTLQEQVNFSSTPMFKISASKRSASEMIPHTN